MKEARASLNTTFTTEDGFECQLTLRDEDEEELAKRFAKVLNSIVQKGGKPVARYRGQERRQAQVTEQTPEGAYGYCPQCGKSLVQKERKDGKGKFIACPGYPQCKYIKPTERQAEEDSY